MRRRDCIWPQGVREFGGAGSQNWCAGTCRRSHCARAGPIIGEPGDYASRQRAAGADSAGASIRPRSACALIRPGAGKSGNSPARKRGGGWPCNSRSARQPDKSHSRHRAGINDKGSNELERVRHAGSGR
jgi:hypothetical protein